jgi:hypothetical protein
MSWLGGILQRLPLPDDGDPQVVLEKTQKGAMLGIDFPKGVDVVLVRLPTDNTSDFRIRVTMGDGDSQAVKAILKQAAGML